MPQPRSSLEILITQRQTSFYTFHLYIYSSHFHLRLSSSYISSHSRPSHSSWGSSVTFYRSVCVILSSRRLYEHMHLFRPLKDDVCSVFWFFCSNIWNLSSKVESALNSKKVAFLRARLVDSVIMAEVAPSIEVESSVFVLKAMCCRLEADVYGLCRLLIE